MPSSEIILVLNQRLKSRMMLALTCLGYLLAYVIDANGLGRGLQSFLVVPVYPAVLFFAFYAFTWINHPSDKLLHALVLVAASLVIFHLTGCLVMNQFRIELVVLLVAYAAAVNLYLTKFNESLVFNSILLSVTGFAFLLRDRMLQQVYGVIAESPGVVTVPPMISWMNLLVFSLLMLLVKIARRHFSGSPAETNQEVVKDPIPETSLGESPIATFLVDATSGLISDCNETAIRLFDGYGKEDFLGKNLHHFQKEPWSEKERKNIQRTLGRKGTVAIQTEFLTLKDRVLNAVWTIHSLHKGGTKIFYATVAEQMSPVAAPVPAGRPMESAQEENRLNSILENTDYAIVSIDRNHVIQVINSRLANSLFDLTGVRVMAGFNLQELIPAGYEQKYMSVFQKAMNGTSSVVEEHLDLPAGKSADIEININPLYSATGHITGVSFFGRNISARKRTELELVHAREQALAEVRAKSAFLATMSHEIRTPLNGVIGMSKLLENTPLTSKQREYVGSLVLSGEALLSVINDILDYSKMESSKMELEHKPFALKRCVEETFDLLAAKASEKNLDLHYTLHRDVPTFIYGDITRLRQVLLNLVSNAIKFTEKGKIVIHVTVAETIATGKYRLQFEVKDTGIGIPADRIDRLFRAYSQASDETTRKYGGTGLGLAISKNLVELMQGQMSVSSKQGAGSSFYFTIVADKADSSQLIAGSSHAAKQLVNAQALIVSDNKTEYLFFAEYFTRWGMKTVATDRAEEMVRLLKGNQSFQVLAIDARMKSAQAEMLAQQARTLRPEEELSIVLFNADEKEKLRFDYTNEVVSAVIPAELDRSKILNILLGVFSEESLHGKRESQLQQLDKNFSGSLPLSILVAEDNVISQKLAVAIFDGLGYRIDIAVNGLQAVQRVKENRYDLVFMDVQMPEMDGFEATRAILHDLKQPPVIIAMTAFALEGDREKCLEAGMSDYISKPILVEEIVEKLQRWGKGDRHGKAGVTTTAHPVSDTTLLDQNVIGRLKELNEKVEQGFFNEVVNMFLNQAPALINEMIIYCNDQRYDKMGQAAHKLKGSALNIGAKAMAELCREIEIKGRNDDGTDCGQSLEKLRALFTETEKELNLLTGN